MTSFIVYVHDLDGTLLQAIETESLTLAQSIKESVNRGINPKYGSFCYARMVMISDVEDNEEWKSLSFR